MSEITRSVYPVWVSKNPVKNYAKILLAILKNGGSSDVFTIMKETGLPNRYNVYIGINYLKRWGLVEEKVILKKTTKGIPKYQWSLINSQMDRIHRSIKKSFGENAIPKT